MTNTNTKHGAYAAVKALKQGKALDRRTRFGKQIARVRDNLLEEIGNNPTQTQLIILDRIIEKVIFLSLIGNYAFDQERIVDEDGMLIPCLGKNYISFSECLRRDLISLKSLGRVDDKNSDLYDQWRQQYIETPSKMQEKTSRKGSDCPSGTTKDKRGK